jgi:hypothetical protein
VGRHFRSFEPAPWSNSSPNGRPIAINAFWCDNEIRRLRQIPEEQPVNARLKYAVVLATLAIAGCGSPKLDASSTKAYQASYKKMTQDMSDTQKRQFAQDIIAALGPEVAQENAKRTLSKDKAAAADPTAMYKPLEGKTVDQIRAMATEYREKRKKR